MTDAANTGWTPDQPMVAIKDRAQILRRPGGAEGRVHGRHEGRMCLHHRPVGVGQVDADPLRQRPQRYPGRLDPGRGTGGQRSRPRQAGTAQESRHGVPAIQFVPAQDGDRKYHDGAGHGSQGGQGSGRRTGPFADQEGASGRQGGRLSGRALRRPAAARRHRPLARHDTRP